MGYARKIAILQFIKRHGLKLCYIANGMGMDEALLRYHIQRGLESPELVSKFKSFIRAHAQGITLDLDEIQTPSADPEGHV